MSLSPHYCGYMGFGSRVWGFRLGIGGFSFSQGFLVLVRVRPQGSGFRVWGLGDLGFGFRVWGFSSWASG